jgi:hypothetical protein
MTKKQDHAFTLKLAIHKLLSRGKEMFIPFIDLKAAFDTIP